MPSRKLTRLLTTPLARPLVPSLEYRASAAAAYTPADEFTGGLNGWLWNGAADQSVFLQSAGGSPAADGDPLGSISDLSGNGNNVVQATGGSKPVCKVNGGIRSAYFTSSKNLGVTFATAVPAVRTEIFVIHVKANTPSAEAYPHVLTGAGGLDFQMIRNTATDVIEVWDGTSWCGYVTCPDYGNTFIFVEQHGIGYGPGVNAYTYNAAGTLVGSNVGMGYHNANTATSMKLGFPAAMIPFHIAFSMGIEGHPDTTDLRTYLANTFGAWSPV